ncbi:MAG: CPBP family intramembrane glutamic endopeptidase, partial [Candidatus Acidiferrum sp.]
RCVVPDTAPKVEAGSSIQRFETVASPVHTVFFLLALTAVAVLGYFNLHRHGSAHPPNHLLFYLTTMAWEWLVFGYICWGLRRHGKSFRNIAGDRWKSASAFFRDLGISAGFWIVAIIVLSVVATLLRAQGMTQAARMLAPHGVLESILWVALAVTAGICEETMFRGYLQRQFVAWTRSAPAGVILSALLFGAGHIYQGAKATVVIAVYGLMFGILAEVRQNLRPGMMVYAWHDTITGLVIRFLPKR